MPRPNDVRHYASMKPTAYDLLDRVRQQKPVVHHLTNWVTIYDCAQVVKTLGASPVMAHAREEAAEMAQIASALVLNIGTLTVDFVEAMKLAAQSANKKGIPVILDVCGAGATALRDRKCLELLNEVRMDVIKGNASEVARVSRRKRQDARGRCHGGRRRPGPAGGETGDQRKATVVMTGKVDIATDGKRTYRIEERPSPDDTRGGDRLHGGLGHWSVCGGGTRPEPGGSVRPRLFRDRGGGCRRKGARPRVVQRAAIRLPLQPGPGNRGPDAEDRLKTTLPAPRLKPLGAAPPSPGRA